MVAATRGNHGLGLAWAGELLGVPGHHLRPARQQPGEERRDPRRSARELIEDGRDYDEAVVGRGAAGARARAAARALDERRARDRGRRRRVALEMLEQAAPAARRDRRRGRRRLAGGRRADRRPGALRPRRRGVRRAGAAARRRSTTRGTPASRARASRPTRSPTGSRRAATYDLTFGALRAGLAGFVDGRRRARSPRACG